MADGKQLILTYAPRKFGRRSKVIATVVLIAGIATGWFGHRHRELIIDRSEFLWSQHCVDVYSKPPDFIAYEEDLAKGSILARSSSEYQPVSPEMAADWQPTLIPVGYRPALPYDRWALQWHVPSIAFIHRLITPAGDSRLVLVDFDVGPIDADSREFVIGVVTRTHGGLFAGVGRNASAVNYLLILRKSDRLRLYFGQPSASDRGKFTLRYELNGEGGKIEGAFDATGIPSLKVLTGKLELGRGARVDCAP